MTSPPHINSKSLLSHVSIIMNMLLGEATPCPFDQKLRNKWATINMGIIFIIFWSKQKTFSVEIEKSKLNIPDTILYLAVLTN